MTETKKLINFFDLCREKTGKSLCDSGDYYGRHYERPPIPEGAPGIRDWHKRCPATIETAVYLTEAYKIDEELQATWVAWDEEHGAGFDYFESAREFMEAMDYGSAGRDNIYNRENDLSQVFVYEVWQTNDNVGKDYIYDNDAVIVIHVHTGCDVRGGYTKPVFCRTKMDYTFPSDLCAQYRITESHDISEVEAQQRDKTWQCGYTSYPFGALEKDVSRWFEFTRTRDSVCVQLHDGTIAKVTAEGPYLG